MTWNLTIAPQIVVWCVCSLNIGRRVGDINDDQGCMIYCQPYTVRLCQCGHWAVSLPPPQEGGIGSHFLFPGETHFVRSNPLGMWGASWLSSTTKRHWLHYHELEYYSLAGAPCTRVLFILVSIKYDDILEVMIILMSLAVVDTALCWASPRTSESSSNWIWR